MLALLSFLWLAVVVWLGLRAWRQRRALKSLEISKSTNRFDADPVTVIVPARNEEQNIAKCLHSIMAQHLPDGMLEVIVVDDASSDRTADIAVEAATTWAAMTVIRNTDLPPGWKGKSHACWVGTVASGRRSEWLCFLDADVHLHPALLASAIATSIEKRIDLLSLAPRHELQSAAERLVLPCGHYLLAFAQDLSRIQAETRNALATGQFMLFRREAYEAIGGHRAVRSAICEDLALACLVKRRGFRVLLLSGDGLLTTRMYTGWRTLWPGFAKNVIETFGGMPKTAALAMAALVLPWAVFLPAIDVAACANGLNSGCRAIAPALVASCAAIAFHIAGAAHFGVPVLYGLLFPIGYSVGALIALDSIRWRMTGRIRWKGRTYS